MSYNAVLSANGNGANGNYQVPVEGTLTLPVQPPSSPPPIQPEPGPTTTEFWQTLLANALAVFIAIFTLLGKPFPSTALTALIPPLAALASALVTGAYARSRSAVKQAAHAATAAQQTAGQQTA
jgi:hypothetical protein